MTLPLLFSSVSQQCRVQTQKAECVKAKQLGRSMLPPLHKLCQDLQRRVPRRLLCWLSELHCPLEQGVPALQVGRCALGQDVVCLCRGRLTSRLGLDITHAPEMVFPCVPARSSLQACIWLSS